MALVSSVDELQTTRWEEVSVPEELQHPTLQGCNALQVALCCAAERLTTTAKSSTISMGKRPMAQLPCGFLMLLYQNSKQEMSDSAKPDENSGKIQSIQKSDKSENTRKRESRLERQGMDSQKIKENPCLFTLNWKGASWSTV
jgi:hypothetical protein